jgi:hypothetical protein
MLACEWLLKSFIRQVRAKETNMNEPILLILDGHGSHDTDEFVRIALEHNVHVLQLPPHTTHKTQPLDVGCFGPTKTAWLNRCDEVVDLTGADIPKSQFVNEFMTVRDQAMTPELIMSSFRKTGISPLNPDIFQDRDFAPSQSSSITGHLPSSYPAEVEDDEDDEDDKDDADSKDGWDDEGELVVVDRGDLGWLVVSQDTTVSGMYHPYDGTQVLR